MCSADGAAVAGLLQGPGSVQLRVWDGRSGGLRRVIECPPWWRKGLALVAISDDGRWLTASGHGIAAAGDARELHAQWDLRRSYAARRAVGWARAFAGAEPVTGRGPRADLPLGVLRRALREAPAGFCSQLSALQVDERLAPSHRPRLWPIWDPAD